MSRAVLIRFITLVVAFLGLTSLAGWLFGAQAASYTSLVLIGALLYWVYGCEPKPKRPLEFTCSKCGTAYPALPPEPAPVLEPGSLEDLRAKFHKAAEAYVSSKSDPDDKLHKRATRTGGEYFACLRNGVQRVPDELKSVNGKGGTGFALVCADDCVQTKR